jgi:hypothetical protein
MTPEPHQAASGRHASTSHINAQKRAFSSIRAPKHREFRKYNENRLIQVSLVVSSSHPLSSIFRPVLLDNRQVVA